MTDVLTVGALGNVLLARWKMLVAFVVLGVLAGIAYGMSAPSTYTSKAVLFVIATPADQDGYYQAAQFAEKRAATYPALLTAPEVLDRTRSALNLDMPASALIAMLTATNPTDSSLVEVAATASTPELASQLAGTAAQNLADYAVDLEDSGNNRGAVTIKLAVPAREPQYPSSPSPLMLGALGGLAGGALGVVAALTTNALRRRPRSSGGEASSMSTTAGPPRDGTVSSGQATPLVAEHPTGSEPGTEPGVEADSATRTDDTADAGDAGAPPHTTEPTVTTRPDETPDAVVTADDPPTESTAPVAPVAPAAVAVAGAPRKRKRRRAHAPAGPVGADRERTTASDAALLDDDSASVVPEPADATSADATSAEGLLVEPKSPTGALASDDEVESSADDEAQPVDGSDVDGAEAPDQVDGAGPKNGRPAPTNGQPARGSSFVRGPAGAAAARKVSTALRPRSSARGR